MAARNGLLYCDPVDPQWSVEHGIQCSAFYRLDERGLYDVRKFVFEDEAGLRGKECSVLVFIQGGWTSICWNILPIPSSARWRPISVQPGTERLAGCQLRGTDHFRPPAAEVKKEQEERHA